METLLEGRAFLEAPRWHNSALYVSDIHGDEVLRIDASGDVEVIAHAERPSGLGFLPDSDLLIACMGTREVLRRRHDGHLASHGQCDAGGSGPINDMVTDTAGRAYIGQVGFDYFAGDSPRPAPLLRMDPDGSVHAVADDLHTANGMVLTPDGKTLIVVESLADRLTAFDVHDDGSLSRRRTWAQLPAHSHPDGACLDSEGAVWVGCLHESRFVRVVEGGEITDVVEVEGRSAVACALGGDDGRTLYLVTTIPPALGAQPPSRDAAREAMRARLAARIDVVTVEIPGARRHGE